MPTKSLSRTEAHLYALVALSLRVKLSFDPEQRLNPGRMTKNV